MIKKITILIILAAVVLILVFLINFQSGSVLVNAVANGDAKLVATLIDEGHDVDGIGKDDWTPLTTAVEKDDAEMVRFLLEKGADPNKIVPGGTALDMALRRQRNASVRVLREFGGRCSSECDLETER